MNWIIIHHYQGAVIIKQYEAGNAIEACLLWQKDTALPSAYILSLTRSN